MQKQSTPFWHTASDQNWRQEWPGNEATTLLSMAVPMQEKLALQGRNAVVRRSGNKDDGALISINECMILHTALLS